mmetsp:Transcript_85/g.244  ORF Transcript_85/g.244 Transcript_85/m.244 type:complete len:239 (-) Transcript_85:13-729(-)
MASRLWETMVGEADKFVEKAETAFSVLFDDTKPSESVKSPPSSSSSSMPQDFEIFEDDVGATMGGEEGSTLFDTANEVLKDVFSQSVGPETFREKIAAFSSAITWEETFIRCLLGMHVVLAILAIIFSRKKSFEGQVILFAIIAGLVYFSEKLNTYGQHHWKEFATQNYFDDQGIFAGTMFAGPLLTICLCMVIDMVREASNLLIVVKRKEIKLKQTKKPSDASKKSTTAKRRSKKED